MIYFLYIVKCLDNAIILEAQVCDIIGNVHWLFSVIKIIDSNSLSLVNM